MIGQKIEITANKLERGIDWIGRKSSWLVLAMVIVTFIVVCLRYLFDTGSIALQESISYMHSVVFLLGASYTLKYNEHVRVDIIYSHLSEVTQAWVDLLGHLFILMPVMIFIIVISWSYVSDAWQVQESSRQAGGLPGVYLLKSLIIIMSALLMVQAVAMSLRCLLTIKQAKQEAN